MDPLIAFLKKQKPEWETYLTMVEQYNAINQGEEDVSELENKEESDFDINDNQEKLTKKKLTKLQQTKEDLLDIIDDLEEELEEEVALNQQLANALGACSDCLGKNPNCEHCEGEGKPGYFVPDFIMYNRYITPAIKAFEQHFQIKN